MKYGAIDIGTNSMRLLLAETENGIFLNRKKFINTTRLGHGIDKNGFIAKEYIELNIESLDLFYKKCKEYGCEKIFCIGTAALRNAKNSNEFVEEAKKRIGLEVEIISGIREAFLGYTGVVGGIDFNDDYVLIIDIGGGSTEFIFGNHKEILYRNSINLGALSATDRFITSMPESSKEINKLKHFINEEILLVVNELEKILDLHKLDKEFKLLGIGGTITSVSAIKQNLEIYSMEKIHGSSVSLKELEAQIKKISSMNLDERRHIKGLQKKRAEIILSGELILKSIMNNLSSSKIQISEFDNLEGVIIEDMSKFNKLEQYGKDDN